MANWLSWPRLERTAINQELFRDLDANPFPPRPDRNARDPYWEMGSHPDVVEHVMDTLGDALPQGCRFLAAGRAVLAHPRTRKVLAMPWGTAYALWLPEPALTEARAAGLSPVRRWSGGSVTDLQALLGEGWVFGAYHPDEPRWLREAYENAW